MAKISGTELGLIKEVARNKRTIKGPAGKGTITVSAAMNAVARTSKGLLFDMEMLAHILTNEQLTELLCHVAIKEGRRAVVDDDLCEQDGDEGKAPAASRVRTQIIDVANNYLNDIADMLDDPHLVIRRLVINAPVVELISKIRISRADRQADVDSSVIILTTVVER